MRWSFALIALSILSCASPQQSNPLSDLREFSSQSLFSNEGEVGCQAMMNSYCSLLYSPESAGNLKIGRGPSSVTVLQGTTSNDFPGVFFAYSKAKLRNRSFFPADFRVALESRSYFTRLRALLNRPPRGKMDLEGRKRDMRHETELDGLWSSAIAETLLARMDAKYPGYHKLKDSQVPVEIQVDEKRMRRTLISEISRSLWRKDPHWTRVVSSFEGLRKHYLEVLSRLDLPDELRETWKARIKAIRLAIPGEIPDIADAECSTTQINAYYYTHLNVLTVCAGDFNSEDIVETLAHEMSHALDLDRSRYLYQQSSQLGKSLNELRGAVCSPTRFSCGAWNEYKDKFQAGIASLNGYQPELPEFQKCLKRRTGERKIGDGDLDRLSTQIAADQISDLASSDIFLRITKPRIPLPNGKFGNNPNYLNPCSYYLWSEGEEPIDDEINTLLYFTAEYRCQEDGDETERFRQAILTAKQMSQQVLKEVLRMEGEFSPRQVMASEGFSSSPAERFADVLGSYAFSSYLETLPSRWDRRNAFLASSSWQCDRPSLATQFPEENAVQQEFVYDAHTDGEFRVREYFTEPVREAVGCKRDFSFDSCELPLLDKAKDKVAGSDPDESSSPGK